MRDFLGTAFSRRNGGGSNSLRQLREGFCSGSSKGSTLAEIVAAFRG